MKRRTSRLALVEIILMCLFGALTVVTLVSREWIEVIFKVDPDQGNGSLEWWIVLALGAATLALAIAARFQWRHDTLATNAT